MIRRSCASCRSNRRRLPRVSEHAGMIEEPGRVVAVEPAAVWVETLRQSSCSACSASAGCGEGVLEKLGISQRHARVRVLTDLQLQVGDAVVIGIPEELLLSSSIQVYLLPLLGLLAAAVSLKSFGFSEPFQIIGGLLCMSLTWLLVRMAARRREADPACQPRVLRASLPVCSVPANI